MTVVKRPKKGCEIARGRPDSSTIRWEGTPKVTHKPRPMRAVAILSFASGVHAWAVSHAVSGLIPSRDSALTMQADASTSMEVDDAWTSGSGGPPFDATELAGVTAPLGFFDPAGFTKGKTEGKIRFYREVEVKHARVAMLAAVGFPLAEQWHPLWGGNIDLPSYVAFQGTPLQTFWPAVILAISIIEVSSVFTFDTPFGGDPWSIRRDHIPGNLGWDPLSLQPQTAAELKAMQTKELNNGRAAMIAFAGMLAQELATGAKLC